MTSEYYLREKCAKAITAQLSKRALDYVGSEMIDSAQKLVDAQAEFRKLVDSAVYKMMEGR